MKVSASMYSFHSVIRKENWDVIDFCRFAETLDLDGIELLDFYWKNKNDELPAVQDFLKNSSLKVSCFDVSNDFVKETKEERLEQVQKVKDAIDTAVALNTSCVRVFCGDVKVNMNFELGKKWIIDGLKECAGYAESQNIILAIENHGQLAGRSEQVREILSEVNSPYVKSTFDTGNFLLVQENPLDAYQNLTSDIAHVHLKDFRKRNDQDVEKGFRGADGTYWIGVVPGEGEVDLEKLLSNLNDDHGDVWLSLEYEGFDDPKTAAAEAIAKTRKWLSSLEV